MTSLLITAPSVDQIAPEALAGRFAPTHDAVLLNLADYEQKSPNALALRILRQIGKRTDLIGTRSVREGEPRTYLPLWVQAHEVTTAVLADAQRLRPWIVRATLDLAPSLNRLICVTEPGHQEEVLSVLTAYGLDARPLPWAEFASAYPRLPDRQPDIQGAYGMEHLPHVDFLLFRHQCRTQNTPERFAAIDADYRSAFQRAHEVLPDEQSIIELLSERTREAVSTAEILVAVRATQRALFARGYLMQVHPDRLLGTLTAIQPPKPHDRHWDALRAYIRPERAAAVALYLLGVPTDNLRSLTLADLTHALETGTIAGHQIPARAAPFLRAQLERRRSEHAQHTDVYLRLTGTRKHQEILADARRDLDIPMDGRNVTSDHKTHFNRALYRIGIQIRPLT